MAKTPLDFVNLSALPLSDLRKGRMGIALSGGGYRASAFHLGTLAYLDRVNLLPQLRMLSTVSCGTFTGAKYVLSLTEKTPFGSFFKDFYSFMRDAKLIDWGLEDYSKGEVRVPSKQRKLISSMANVYADTFLKSPDGRPYTFDKILDDETLHIEEIIFNAIEFRDGIAFRFQKSKSPSAPTGNEKVSIPKEAAKKIRVADIVAASSCFPGGFEPMAFPIDFAWPDNQVPLEVKKAINRNKPQEQNLPVNLQVIEDHPFDDTVIALMDGGIYDNQSIDSLLLANERKQTKDLDFFIISDVDPTKGSAFPYPAPKPTFVNLTIGQLDLLLRTFLVICFLTVVAVGYDLWREITQGDFAFSHDFFSAVMPLILVAFGTATVWYGRNLISNYLLPLIPQAGRDAWTDLKTLRVNEFWYVMKLRIESVLALTNGVFMDRIKALIFKDVYSNPQYKGKRISNRINRLLQEPFRSVKGIAAPSRSLRAIVKTAADMPTTLWFSPSEKTKQNQLDSLVIAGQATICFNLLQYIDRRYKKSSTNGSMIDMADYPEIEALWKELKDDWIKLNDNPYSLLDERRL